MAIFNMIGGGSQDYKVEWGIWQGDDSTSHKFSTKLNTLTFAIFTQGPYYSYTLGGFVYDNGSVKKSEPINISPGLSFNPNDYIEIKTNWPDYKLSGTYYYTFVGK